jgi:hypothetical protein
MGMPVEADIMSQPPETTEAVRTVEDDSSSSSSISHDHPSLHLPILSLHDVMESVVRITLAGLGGSILGLSQEHKLQSLRVVSGAAATAAARRRRVATSTNVPLQWAISCMAFCAIIETSRRLVLTRRTVEAMTRRDIIENYEQSPYITAASTISDYTMGGGVGGLAASMGRQTHLRQQLPPSILRGSKRFVGVVPGLALGFVAGICQAATDGGIAYLERCEDPGAATEQSPPTKHH